MKKSILFGTLGLALGMLAGCGNNTVSRDYIKEHLPTEQESYYKNPDDKKIVVEDVVYPEGTIESSQTGSFYDKLKYYGCAILENEKGYVGIYNKLYKKWIIAPQFDAETAFDLTVDNEMRLFNRRTPYGDYAFICINNGEKTIIVDIFGNLLHEGEKVDLDNIHLSFERSNHGGKELFTLIVSCDPSFIKAFQVFEDGSVTDITDELEEYINPLQPYMVVDLERYGVPDYKLRDYRNGLVEVVKDGEVITKYTFNADDYQLEGVYHLANGIVICQYEYDVSIENPDFTYRDYDDDKYYVEHVKLNLLTGETELLPVSYKLSETNPYYDSKGELIGVVVSAYKIDEETKVLAPMEELYLVDKDLNLLDDFTNKLFYGYEKFGDMYYNDDTNSFYDKDLNFMFYLGEYVYPEQYISESNMLVIYDDNIERYGAIDIEGKIILPFEYDNLYFSENAKTYYAESYEGTYLKKYDGTVVKEFSKTDEPRFVRSGYDNTYIVLDNADYLSLYDMWGTETPLISYEKDSVHRLYNCTSVIGTKACEIRYVDKQTTDVKHMLAYISQDTNIQCKTYGKATSEPLNDGSSIAKALTLTLDTPLTYTKPEEEPSSKMYFRYTPTKTGIYKLNDTNNTINETHTYKNSYDLGEIPYFTQDTIVLIKDTTYYFAGNNSAEINLELTLVDEVQPLTAAGEEVTVAEYEHPLIRSFTPKEDGLYKFTDSQYEIVLNESSPAYEYTKRGENYRLAADHTYLYAIMDPGTDVTLKIPEKIETDPSYMVVENDEANPWTYNDKTNTYTSNMHNGDAVQTLKFTVQDSGVFNAVLVTSTEDAYDVLEYYHNGNLEGEISGYNNRVISLTVTCGDVIEFKFSKDDSNTVGEDRVSVINPVFVPRLEN